MVASLLAVLVLLLVMVALIVQPFVASARPAAPIRIPPGHEELPVRTASTPAPLEPSANVRNLVEAAISARKSALSGSQPAATCPGCSAPADAEYAFCGKCGTKLL